MGTQPGWRAHFLFPLTRYAGSRCVLRINAVFQRLAWLERNSVAGLDFDGLTSLRVFAGAGTAVALQEGTEAHQRDAVLAVPAPAKTRKPVSPSKSRPATLLRSSQASR